jgi:RNA polymerase primary sigma factor
MIRAEVRFKNSAFISALNDANYKSIQHFSRESGIKYSYLIAYANLQMIFDNTQFNDFEETKKTMVELLNSDEETLFDQYRYIIEDDKKPKKIVTDIPLDRIVSLQNKEVLELETPEVNSYIKEDVAEALGTIKERERDVIMKCFGIGCEEKPLDEIAEEYGLTRERIRQIKDKGIRRLRHRSRSRKLRQHLG